MSLQRSEESRTYSINEKNVDLNTTSFSSPEFSKNLLIFPGFGMNNQSKSLEEIAREFSDKAQMNSYVIHTSQKDISPSFDNRAEAVSRFVGENNLNRLHVLGYSEGGSIATRFAHKNPSVEALMLLAPMGLEKQSAYGLAARFALSALVLGPVQALYESKADKEVMQTHIEAGTHVRNNLIREIKEDGLLNFLNRLRFSIMDLSSSNLEKLNELNKPLLILQGEKDIVSRPINPEKVSTGKVIKVMKLSNHNFPFYDTAFTVQEILSELEN